MDEQTTFSTKSFYWLLLVVVTCNLTLWLDSFDRYLSSRYHFYLSAYLPDAAYIPSRDLQVYLNTAEQDTGLAANAAELPAPAVEPVTPAQATDALAATSAPIATPAAVSGAGASAVADAAPPVLFISAVVKVEMPAATGVSAASAVAAATPAKQNAPRILFAGDSMMQGVAPIVISRMRRKFPKGLFVDLSKESTGLTVKRYFDWPTKIKDETIKQKFNTVVIFLGPNDPWDIYEGKRRYVFPSKKWEGKYRSRVDEVLEFASARGIRLIWIGLPVMREDRYKKGAEVENRIFREETAKFNFEYMSTEDLLGSVDEPYRKYIVDPKKGKLVVRANDGIHFTSTGLRIISARVEKLIRSQEQL